LSEGYGHESADCHFQGGTIYNDAASGLIWVENQVLYGIFETSCRKNIEYIHLWIYICNFEYTWSFCGQISNISHKMTTTHKIENGGTGPVTSNIRESPRIFEVMGPNIEYGEFIAKFDIWVLFLHQL
jgi:hypothetical protein